MARRASCLAMLDRQLQQLEMDRALVKRELVDIVDQEFDKLRNLTLKIKAEILETGNVAHSPSPSDDADMSDENDSTAGDSATIDGTDDQLEANNAPSTSSSSSRGRKRSSTSTSRNTSAPVPRKRPRNWTCIYPGCGKAFPQDSKLATHERIHTGVRPFTCAWPGGCDYDAAIRGDVVKHIRAVHLKLPLHKKDQLAMNITDRRDPARWIRVNQLLVHKRLAQADIASLLIKSKATKVNKRQSKSKKLGKFVCRSSGCGQRFQFSSYRLRHERAIHLKSKPFGCTWPDCGFVASVRSDVVTHVRTVHFGLPKTVKLQRQLSITDDRDPNQWVSVNQDQTSRRVIE